MSPQMVKRLELLEKLARSPLEEELETLIAILLTFPDGAEIIARTVAAFEAEFETTSE